MPARTFFAILEQSRKHEGVRRNSMMMDFCDIAAISICNGDYQEKIKASFQTRIVGGSWQRGPTAKMDSKDPRAKATLDAIFKQKGKLEGLNG